MPRESGCINFDLTEELRFFSRNHVVLKIFNGQKIYFLIQKMDKNGQFSMDKNLLFSAKMVDFEFPRKIRLNLIHIFVGNREISLVVD